MAQPAPNCVVDLYRGFNPADPYSPPTVPAAANGLPGLLRPHVRHGRFGRGAHLHWTNILLLPLGTDVRSAYDSQLNSLSPSAADTIMVPNYPQTGMCTAFLTVLVQRIERGRADDHLRCCLDRAQPRAGACPDSSGITVPCCANALPTTLHATFTNVIGCASVHGVTVPLTWNGSEWANDAFDLCPICVGMALRFSCSGTDCTGFRLTFGPPAPCAGVVGPFAAASCSCAPLVVEFVLDAIAPFECCGGATPQFSVTVTQ